MRGEGAGVWSWKNVAVPCPGRYHTQNRAGNESDWHQANTHRQCVDTGAASHHARGSLCIQAPPEQVLACRCSSTTGDDAPANTENVRATPEPPPGEDNGHENIDVGSFLDYERGLWPGTSVTPEKRTR